MFVITENSNKHLWGNNKQDDFLRFLLDHFQIASNTIGIELVPDEVVAWLDTSGKSLDVSTAGFVQKKIDEVNDGSPIALIPVTWPYDENMNFLGIP